MVTEEQIRQAIQEALDKLMENDRYLFEKDVNERTLTHRMAIFLEEKIGKIEPGWNVDCEYNRDVSSETEPYSKKLQLSEAPPCGYDAEPYQDENATTVFPDIIVHKRGKSGDEEGNLAVIEVKKSTSTVGSDFDRTVKLPAYLTYLKYRHAYFVTLYTKDQCNYNVESIRE